MDNLRLGLVQPIHALSELLEHAHALVDGQRHILLLEQALHVAREKLGHNAHVAGRGTSTHEEQRVGMAQTSHNLDLLLKVCQRLRIQILLEEPLHSHLFSSARSSVDGSKLAFSELFAQHNLMRLNVGGTGLLPLLDEAL